MNSRRSGGRRSVVPGLPHRGRFDRFAHLPLGHPFRGATKLPQNLMGGGAPMYDIQPIRLPGSNLHDMGLPGNAFMGGPANVVPDFGAPRHQLHDPNPRDPNMPSLVAKHVNGMSDQDYNFHVQQLQSRSSRQQSPQQLLDKLVQTELGGATMGKYYHHCPGKLDHRGNPSPRCDHSDPFGGDGFNGDGFCRYGGKRNPNATQPNRQSAQRGQPRGGPVQGGSNHGGLARNGFAAPSPLGEPVYDVSGLGGPAPPGGSASGGSGSRGVHFDNVGDDDLSDQGAMGADMPPRRPGNIGGQGAQRPCGASIS
ncbi:hypothetical protein N7G274_009296 [Stereocaulon virgatum]|uniref:Uncharacterized protein n=1 Tax=Stereocaulon virgatum TaxID=373712 RepID=A0ABR3ZZF1_9LECA